MYATSEEFQAMHYPSMVSLVSTVTPIGRPNFYQSVQKHGLIRIFAGHTRLKIGFVLILAGKGSVNLTYLSLDTEISNTQITCTSFGLS